MTSLAVSLLAACTLSFAQVPSPVRQGELKNILYQDCGSCHGMTLKGGLGPALTRQALRGKPRRYLEVIISEGAATTPMPPWKHILSAADIAWLAAYLHGDES